MVTTPYKEWWFVCFSSFFHEERDFHTHPPYFFFFLISLITLERPPPIINQSSRAQTTKRRNSFFFSPFFSSPLFSFHLFMKQRRFSCLLTFTTTRRHINEHPKRSASKKETNCILPPGVDMSRHGRYSVSFTLSLARSLSRVCGARFDLRSDGARSLSRIAQRSLLCNELLTSFVNLCDVQ